MKKIFWVLTASLIFGACKKKEISYEEQLVKDSKIIEDYLSAKGLKAEKTNSGLYYIHTLDGGGGSRPDLNSLVEVYYKGYYTDDKIFDQTGSSTSKFYVYEVIKGWQEGIPLMKKGGKSTFFIPSGMGYGSTPPGSVRKNAVLIFEVELVNF